MCDEQKRERFQTLRERELEGALTPAEQTELSLLIQEIENAEAAYLGPATERLRREREQLEAQNHALEDLVRRKQALAERLRTVLEESAAERHTIDKELARILGTRLSTGTGVSG
ncbi:MAG: hypothetical protein M3347_12735 [Armatimonadota bacterium]|nr:hypothetical protein [Armatimonadota bacterium]